MNTTMINIMIASATNAQEILKYAQDYIYLCQISEKLFGFGMTTVINSEDMSTSFENWMSEHKSETIGIEPWSEKQLDYGWVQDLIGMFSNMSGEDVARVARYIEDWCYLHQILKKLFEMQTIDRESASKALAEFCYSHNCETIAIEPWSEKQLDYGWAQDLIGMFGLDNRKDC